MRAQVDQCVTLSVLDWTTVRSAMKNKIRDLTRTLKNDHRIKNKLEKELLNHLNGKSWVLRKKIKEMKFELEKERLELIKNHEQKLKHYKDCQKRLDSTGINIKTHKLPRVIPTITPHDLSEYSTLLIFGPSEDLPTKQKLLGPFIVDKNIKLSKGEVQLLSRDPKFSVKYPPSKMGMSTEVERMNAKTRYDKKKDLRVSSKIEITNAEGVPIVHETENKKIEAWKIYSINIQIDLYITPLNSQ